MNASNTIELLPDECRKVLVALAKFRLLTVKQMVRLGVSKAGSAPYIRNEVIRRLRDRKVPYTKQSPRVFAQPQIHYMTKAGAQELEELYSWDTGSVPYLKGVFKLSPIFVPHRLAQIDFHIEFELWVLSWGAQARTLFADQDFFVEGSQRSSNFVSKTQITLSDGSTIKPDGIFGVEMNGHPAFYVVEIHRTTDTNRVIAQVMKYLQAIESGAFSYKYGLKIAPHICSVHMKDSALAGIKNAIRQHPHFADINRFFLFNKGEQIAQDFTKGWHTADGKPANPFPLCSTPSDEPLLD